MGLGIPDYRAAFLALLPPGIGIRRDGLSAWWKLATAMATEPWRLDGRARTLVREADPNQATELLPEWETLLALPDDCYPPAQTLEARRAAVVSKLTGLAEPTPAGLEALATTVGEPATVVETSPALAGVLRAGDPINGEAWAYAFYVQAGATTVVDAVAGTFAAGDPLRDWGSKELECAIEAAKPAHTVAAHTYA